MAHPLELNRRSWNERVAIHVRDATGFYGVDAFRAGKKTLHAIEDAELGDVAGKRLLHLQCHFGLDTLSLARRGAIVTGLDFSSAAIEAAQLLAAETGLDARFVEGPVERAPELTPGPFDLVFTTWGTIAWLPDVEAWARAISTVLRPGGELYFADAHPNFLVFEEEAGRLMLSYDFDTPKEQPLSFTDETTYTGDATVLCNQATRNWIHSLSSVLSALTSAGMTIALFREHEVLPWRGLPCLVPTAGRMWRLPDGHPRFPLSYSLRAQKV